MTTAEDFFAGFLTMFRSLAEDPGSEIGLYYRSYGGGKKTYDAWTHAMAVFLMRLATHFGHFQLSKRIDFKWIERPNPSEEPIVSIEHENNPDGIETEIKKLLLPRGKEPGKGTRAPLKVLITYIKRRKREKDQSTESRLAELKTRAMEYSTRHRDFDRARDHFLFIIGEEKEVPVQWFGFTLDWNHRKWRELGVAE